MNINLNDLIINPESFASRPTSIILQKLIENLWSCRDQTRTLKNWRKLLGNKNLFLISSVFPSLQSLIYCTKTGNDIVFGFITVNNAGLAHEQVKIWELDAQDFDNVIDTNIKGIANVLRHFLPLMMATKQGIVVNISSSAGRDTHENVRDWIFT